MVHIEDRGYQFSDGVYEVCEVRDGLLIDERRHGGFAVGARHGDHARVWQEGERDLNLTDHGNAGRGCRENRRRRRGNPGTRHEERCAGNALQIVFAAHRIGAKREQLFGGLAEFRARTAVRRVDARALAYQQFRHGPSTPAESEYGYLAARKPLAHHRNLSVVSATKAQRIPRIQKRITTCVSGHPLSSKW